MTIAGNFNGETVQEAGSLQSLANLSKKKKNTQPSPFLQCVSLTKRQGCLCGHPHTNLFQLSLPIITTVVY